MRFRSFNLLKWNVNVSMFSLALVWDDSFGHGDEMYIF